MVSKQEDCDESGNADESITQAFAATGLEMCYRASAHALFPNPIALIDPNCDLDAVLRSRTIGEAMQQLVPNMPGWDLQDNK